MDTPVALIVFNRPDCTVEVLKALRLAKPNHLMVVADGPRTMVSTDAQKCGEVRALIDSMVDWDCRLDKCYSDINLGCKRRPETGIDWVFNQVDRAIILEDDCLPDQSFFTYCESLLQKYKDDERVMMISGYSFFETIDAPQSYYYSFLASTWGWATWRRAWLLNDPFMSNWAAIKDSQLIEKLFPHPVHTKYWYDVFAKIQDGSLPDAWDYQWQLSCWMNNGYRIFPHTNLVRNIGHGPDATHTFSPNIYSNKLNQIKFPLEAPKLMVRSYAADHNIMNSFCLGEGYILNHNLLGRLHRLARLFRYRLASKIKYLFRYLLIK